MKLMDLARSLDLLARPAEQIAAASQEVARRSQADEFRRRRNRAFRGIVSHRTVLELYKPTRHERAQERILAGGMARMDQQARRQARRAAEVAAHG